MRKGLGSSLIIALLILPPLIGGSWPQGFPLPQTANPVRASFSWIAFVLYGILVLAITTPFLIRFLRAGFQKGDTPCFRLGTLPWWGYAGLGMMAVTWTLAWTRFEWFASLQVFTFTPLWISYILVVNALLEARTGTCLLTGRSVRFLLLFPASAAFWWFFEYLNGFVQNWHYSLGSIEAIQSVCHASIAFSTVLPAVLSTQRLLFSFPSMSRAFLSFLPIQPKKPRGLALGLLLFSALGLALIGVYPEHLFSLLWISPLVVTLAVPTFFKQSHLLSSVSKGDWRGPVTSAQAALVCGFFWEMWNYYSLAKWHYTVPHVHGFLLFEMPLLGYAGYLPFGMECAQVAWLLGLLRPDSIEQPPNRGERFFPLEMRIAPALDPDLLTSPPAPRLALLINPFYPKDPDASFGKHVLTPGLSLTSVAGATPPEWRVKFWDENLLQGPPPHDPFPEVVGITVNLTSAERAYELAAWYQERGASVILGGPHVISCPEEAAAHADAICIGEGAFAWHEFLLDCESNKMRAVYQADFGRSYREAPLPKRTLIPRNSFLTPFSLTATRGCRNRCDFCYLSTRGLSLPYQARPIEEVVAEIKADVAPYAVFLDNNLGADPKYLADLCKALEPLNRIWSAAVNLEITDDPDLVRGMALAGCTGVFIGFESLYEKNLKENNKRSPRPEEYARRVQVFKDQGIHVNGSFVFGFDNDKPDVFEKTVAWIEETRLACATFHILTPYPGTPLFRKLEAEGRLLHTDWNRYDTAHAVFAPKHMEPRELEEGYRWCYQRLFSFKSIWKRRPRPLSIVPIYLLMTCLYKRSNPLWHFLIRHRLTAAVWRPFILHGRRRHLRFRCDLKKR